MKIENTRECFVRMWKLLASTRRVLRGSCKRFCMRNVLKLWRDEGLFSDVLAVRSFDDLCFEVSRLAGIEGYELLKSVRNYPYKHRELMCAVVAVCCGIGTNRVDKRMIDHAFSLVFPHALPLNVCKKKRTPASCS